MKFINKKQILWVIVIAAILTFFKTPIHNFLNFFIVEPLLQDFELNTFGELFLLAILVSYSVWATQTMEKPLLINISIIVLTFYIFQRFNETWNFAPFSILNYKEGLKYWDFIVIGIVSPSMFCFLIEEDDQKIVLEDPRGFVSDNPVDKVDDDLFGRNNVAKQIATMITHTNSKRSFAIGILGEYGSGKTSFLNLISGSMPPNSCEKLSFNPWTSENAESIQKDFFDMLATKLAKLDPRITSLIYSYSRKLSSTDENSKRWLNRIGLFNDFQKGIISNDYDKINDILKRTNKKILIIIDDIDRLYNEEVIEVLRIIRNTADFANVFYLVAYEKTYVQNAIKSLNDQSASNYLDKIFQVEIPLPKREQDALVDFLKVKINTILSEEHFKILDERIIPLGLKDPYEESYAQIFRHSRDVIKFVNGFKLVYTLIGDEVSFEDLFVLELIKFRFPLVYDVIYEEQDTLLYLKPSMASHDEFFLVRQEKKGDDMFNIFDIYIEQSGLVKKNELELLCTLFNRLFSTGNFHRPAFKNGISYPLYFEVFFRQRLSKYDLSDKDFKIALQTNKINKFINDCVTKNLHDAILTRLLQEDIVKTSRDYFENIVMALFYLGPRYILKKSTSSFPYIQLLDKIIDYSGLIAKNFYKKDEDEYRIFIRTFFKMAQPPFLFESQLIYHIVESKRPFIISTNELIEFQIQYFKSIVETLHGLNENAVWLFWGIREYYELEHKTEKKRNWKFVPDVIPILIKALKKNNITLFLKNTIERNIWENEMACINKHIIEMFETPQEFRQIVNDNIYIDDAIKKEYIELYDACEKINFSKMVSFTFKTELKK